ncbi:MAG: cobalamin biosynthesis protein P47K [Planctomycetaceae bacterium]|nr:cobalamin biosynthesis protein P47K [Planctomycetaceae bacterium]
MSAQDPVRYVMVGGFLGAGKTTTLSRLAGIYQQAGLNVGIVTNDQAEDLVDTGILRNQGYEVSEVAGACFCCRFNDLTECMQNLGEAKRPDIILAEPVGSCTDLVATVIQPLKHLFNRDFSIAPYLVILKPSHGRKILAQQGRTGFSPKAEYILKKQLEEADGILINRCDELTSEEVEELKQLVSRFCPETPVIAVSAVEGTGFDEVAAFLEQQGDFGTKILDIDYDVYAEGEAELGWLNCSTRALSDAPFDLDQLLLDLIDGIRDQLHAIGAEPAHLKAIGLWEGFFGVANVISSDSPTRLSLPCRQQVAHTDLVINARVACAPEQLEQIVRSVLQQQAEKRGLELSDLQLSSFRPGRPMPTHRYSSSTM